MLLTASKNCETIIELITSSKEKIVKNSYSMFGIKERNKVNENKK